MPQVVVPHVAEIQLAIESTAQIDWSKSAVYFDRNAVVED